MVNFRTTLWKVIVSILVFLGINTSYFIFVLSQLCAGSEGCTIAPFGLSVVLKNIFTIYLGFIGFAVTYLIWSLIQKRPEKHLISP
jgi:hypothetical protein